MNQYIKKLLSVLFFAGSFHLFAQVPHYDKTHEGFLVFHAIRTDPAGNILPWYSNNPGESYDHVLNLIWNFWDTMRTDMNGLPYYMNHQVWRPVNDPRGIGGDQFNMALSSWTLFYMYTGNEKVKENMKFIADYYLTHSLSPPDALWPDIPFPYNTLQYSGFYDGVMVIGKDYTQPDKAGNFGHELIILYKMTGNINYLNAAIRIASTLAKHTVKGDSSHSPLPFKVNVYTGETGSLKSNSGDNSITGHSSYTTDWPGTMTMFMELIKMKKGDTLEWQTAFHKLLTWMVEYPLKTNKWGPFFEDIPGWSDTQINAVTFARFMMLHPELFPEWKSQVRGILDWVYRRLGNDEWKKYGVKVINEQTVYETPGNSHTSRQAAAELLYSSMTGATEWKENAIRELSWATYMVDNDGKNNYPRDEVWLTDGYGDYVRHFLRAMAADPDLAPDNANHILSSTSVISIAGYFPDLNKRLSKDVTDKEAGEVEIFYRTYDRASTELIRMIRKPGKIAVDNHFIPERRDLNGEGWTWEPLDKGGIIRIKHEHGNAVKVF